MSLPRNPGIPDTPAAKPMTFDEAAAHPDAILGYNAWAPRSHYDSDLGKIVNNESERPAEYDTATVNGITYHNPRTLKPGTSGTTPAGYQFPKEATRKVAKVGEFASESIPKDLRFASNLRPANISEDHWNTLGELGNRGKEVRAFISMYAHKWHSIKDGENKYSLDQLKNDRDTIQKFFSGDMGDKETYNGGYFKIFRHDLPKPKADMVESVFGKIPNEGWNDEEVNGALGKGIVDNILKAYPTPE